MTIEPRVVKLYQNVGLQGGGHYKSFRVGLSDTFAILKRRALDKNGINRIDAPFFSIIVKFQNAQATSRFRNSLRPSDDEYVIDVLNREEEFHDGDLLLIFSDIRFEFSYRTTSKSRNPPSTSVDTAAIFHYDTSTEFMTHSHSRLTLDANKTVLNILISELESISLKQGKLQIYQPINDVWR